MVHDRFIESFRYFFGTHVKQNADRSEDGTIGASVTEAIDARPGNHRARERLHVLGLSPPSPSSLQSFAMPLPKGTLSLQSASMGSVPATPKVAMLVRLPAEAYAALEHAAEIEVVNDGPHPVRMNIIPVSTIANA